MHDTEVKYQVYSWLTVAIAFTPPYKLVVVSRVGTTSSCRTGMADEPYCINPQVLVRQTYQVCLHLFHATAPTKY